MKAHEESVAALVSSADAARLTSVGEDGSVWTSPLDIDSWLVQACRIVDPGVSKDDWERLLPGRPYPESCRII